MLGIRKLQNSSNSGAVESMHYHQQQIQLTFWTDTVDILETSVTEICFHPVHSSSCKTVDSCAPTSTFWTVVSTPETCERSDITSEKNETTYTTQTHRDRHIHPCPQTRAHTEALTYCCSKAKLLLLNFSFAFPACPLNWLQHCQQ